MLSLYNGAYRGLFMSHVLHTHAGYCAIFQYGTHMDFTCEVVSDTAIGETAVIKFNL